MEKKISKVEQVYEYLLRQMVEQHYKAGDRLVISQIAKACNVSEIPVREALRRLESDGYVKINANQGAIAIGFDADSILNIFQIKGLLEGYATRLSINYLSPIDLIKLREINEDLRKAARAQDYATYSDLNVQFHMFIYGKTQKKELINLIQDLWKKWHITTRVFSLAPGRMDISYLEHEQIVCLIEARKYDEVEKYVRVHKFHAAEQLIAQLPGGSHIALSFGNE
jgi:DNA-binding GntR family transcriptional regulator